MIDDIPPPFDTLWFKLFIGALLGLCLGSFITMLSYRLPRKLSLFNPSTSFCPSCNTKLGPRDLMPVLSWVLAKGKCRYCRAPIGKRYIAIEIATAAMTAIAVAFWFLEPVLILAITAIIIVTTLVVMKMES